MHPLNPYYTRKPDFEALAKIHPDFAKFASDSDTGQSTIDFQDPAALRALTSTLLKEDWKLDVDLREDRLCPTVANRVDYLLHVLDLEPHLPPRDGPLKVLDIGTGSIAIYPILLHRMRPTCQIIATELDEISLKHAQMNLERNSISSNSINLLQPKPTQSILFPLLDDTNLKLDFTICNPPFFSSEEEMKQGQELKNEGAPAVGYILLSQSDCFQHSCRSKAPTAAPNELVTEGGEVGFVSRMIKDSFEIGERCSWYTSLIGKYASLDPLVKILHERQCNNYFILSIRPSRTTRWIIGWSHTPYRLPDKVTRPVPIIPHTSFAKLIPLANTTRHTPDPPLSVKDLRQVVIPVLHSVGLLTEDQLSGNTTEAQSNQDSAKSWGQRSFGERITEEFELIAKSNTWSRAARRQAARAAAEGTGGGSTSVAGITITDSNNSLASDKGESGSQSGKATEQEPLFRAKLRFITKLPSKIPTSSDQDQSAISSSSDCDNLVKEVESIPPKGDMDAPETDQPTEPHAIESTADVIPSSLEIEWRYGRDRSSLDGFWKFLLTKAELLRHGDKVGGAPDGDGGGGTASKSESHNSSSGGARGGRGRGRGRGRGNGDWRGDSRGRGRGVGRGRDGGWGGRGRGHLQL